MDADELKHKLRELKKAEEKIRFGHTSDTDSPIFVWDEYFNTKSINALDVKYPIWKLLKLDKRAMKEVFAEYFYSVYFRKYRDMGMDFDEIQDPGVLDYFGLNPGASVADVKKRFRELAKKYHPDCGGNSERMVEVLDAYHRLLNKD